MTTMQISLALLALVLLLVWWWVRRGSAAPSVGSAERIDTVTGWPPQPTRVLSTPERLAYGALVRALPEYMILAQVPLARFINVPRRNSYADWLRRVGNQCADFVVCDMAAQVIAVVELQGPSPGERARKRMARITRTLKAAKIPLQLWSESAIPSADMARTLILPKPDAAVATAPLAAPPPVTPAAPAAPAEPAPGAVAASPFDDSNRDSTQDEMIELLEPPPSTWYDDLDTGPAPLKKK